MPYFTTDTGAGPALPALCRGSKHLPNGGLHVPRVESAGGPSFLLPSVAALAVAAASAT